MTKLILALLAFLVSNASFAQNTDEDFKPSGKVWGYAFGDYFYKIEGDSTSQQTEYSGYRKDFNAFEFRRVYLGFDYSISPQFSSEFVLSYEGRDLTSNGSRAILLKDASLKWKDIFEGSDLVIGLMPTPAYSFISEKVWGYRSVEKTILDMRGLVSSRDIGISLRGFFDEGKFYGYNAMIGNGRGTRLENNKYKKYYASLYSYFIKRKLVADVYFDYEPLASRENRMTYKGFIGYQADNFSAGVEVFQQQHKLTSGPEITNKSFGVMAFVNGQIIKDRLKIFGRYDYFDPLTNSSSGYRENFISAGLDIMPYKNVHFMPNIWINIFNKKVNESVSRDSDIAGRLTFFYTYR